MIKENQLRAKEKEELFFKMARSPIRDYRPVVEALLKSGISLEIKDKNEKTPLLQLLNPSAFNFDHVKNLIEYLLKKDTNVNVVDNNNNNILHSSFIYSVKEPEKLINKISKKNINLINNRGKAPLDRFEIGSDLYKLLESKGAKHHNINYLQYYVYHRNFKELKKEIIKQKNNKYYYKHDNERIIQRAKDKAIAKDDLDIVKVFLDQNIKIKDKSYDAIYSFNFNSCIKNDQTKVLKYLLKNKIETGIESLDLLKRGSKIYNLLKNYGFKHVYPISGVIQRTKGKDLDEIKYFLDNYEIEKEGIVPLLTTLKYSRYNQKEILELLFSKGLKFELRKSYEEKDIHETEIKPLGTEYKLECHWFDLVEYCLHWSGQTNIEGLRFLKDKGYLNNINGLLGNVQYLEKFDKKSGKHIKIDTTKEIMVPKIYEILGEDHRNITFEVLSILIEAGLNINYPSFSLLHQAVQLKARARSLENNNQLFESLIKMIEDKKISDDILYQKDIYGNTAIDYLSPFDKNYDKLKSLMRL
ncbi:MAG: hypothetical protein GY830_08850 [Bacteroidetes bacterium]|nr:hypothetical protein [Bacteroidota bacterium]